MDILICIDDTDNLDSRGTGEIAELLGAEITRKGWGECGQVTRHQLLLHPDIAYTSHNSSMCFPARISPDVLDTVIAYCGSALSAESAPGSDPGLCVMVPERVGRQDLVIEFGRRAKREVLTLEEAYRTARDHGIHLSGHGGTGLGVIGALAGAGLRLTGGDGRFKGKLRIPAPDGIASVLEIRAAGIAVVQTVTGDPLGDLERVQVGEWVKPVLIEGRAVLLVLPVEGNPGTAWKAAGRKVFAEY